ncbi:hypothetical protein [Chitinophaga solisilvae]|uniref:hypothetical protein n=1 Tax=Chitinophaga solisilvae TaxID=1233460 RepID=UPI00136B0758|nr:hypothetical protein [Chitinophaga solisilvae]
MEKIIRQKIDHDKYDITRSNYKKVATDRIRFRTVYLFKENWEPEHECINRKWSLKEKNIANSRKGDLEELAILLGVVASNKKEKSLVQLATNITSRLEETLRLLAL